MGVVRKVWKLADRTAVLAVGLVAGFAIGVSFNAGGRGRIAGWFQPGVGPRLTVPAAATGVARDLGAPVTSAAAKRVAADGRLRIGVFGDSFGNGLWDALYRQLPAAEYYDVLKFSKEATGFTRYHSLDLEEEARRQLARQPIDVAIVCFGANDLQPIYEEHGLQPLLSDKWRRIIGARIDRFVAVARSTGAAVFWVGLPVMRDADTDDQIQALDGFYAERMRALKVPFVDTRPASLDPDGHYNAHLINPATGKPELARTPDGMHMTGVGYRRITADLVARVRAYATGVRRQAGLAAPEPVAPAAQPVAPPQTPPPPRRRHPTEPAGPETSVDAAEREARQTARANRREADRVERLEKTDRPANAVEAAPAPAEPGK